MKSIALLVFCGVVALTTALPVPADDPKERPEVVKYVNNHNGDKGYDFAVETSDGSKHQETGEFKYVGGLSVRGSYEYLDDDGSLHTVNYIADEKGFRVL